MTHTIVTLAEDVLRHKSEYSERVVFRANLIVEWNLNRRDKIAKLWRTYRKAYKAYVVGVYGLSFKTRVYKTKEILIATLGNRFNASDIHNDFHLCKNALHNRKDMRLSFEKFKACVEASKSKEVALMHQYVCCVNAKRYDYSLVDVGFLRWIDPHDLVEIILFRLMHTANG